MVILKLLFIVIASVSSIFASETPEWYGSASLPHESYEIIGYGSGSSLAEAETNARSEIAKSLIVNINSKMNITYSQINEEQSKQIAQDIKETANLVLSGIEIIKRECKNNKCYVALKYINLPLAAKINKQVGDSACKKLENNKYLLHTQFFKELQEEIGCYPVLKFYNIGNNIFAELNGTPFYISPNDFLKLFTEVDNEYFSLTPTKKVLKSGDIYQLKLSINRDGYLSVYQVSKIGGVSVLIDNEYVLKDMDLIYPETDKYEGLEAYLSENDNREIDLTIATLCNEKINNNMFGKISNEKQIPNSGFGSLIKMISQCDINSKIIEVWR